MVVREWLYMGMVMERDHRTTMRGLFVNGVH